MQVLEKLLEMSECGVDTIEAKMLLDFLFSSFSYFLQNQRKTLYVRGAIQNICECAYISAINRNSEEVFIDL